MESIAVLPPAPAPSPTVEVLSAFIARAVVADLLAALPLRYGVTLTADAGERIWLAIQPVLLTEIRSQLHDDQLDAVTSNLPEDV